MSLITKIENIVTALYPDATFILSSTFKASRKSFDLQNAEYPLIVLDNELEKNASIKQNNNVIKETRILISVLEKDSAYNTDAQRNSIVEDMEIIGDRLAVNIYQLEEVRPISEQKYKITPAFNVFTSQLSGVIIDIIANENIIVNFCKT